MFFIVSKLLDFFLTPSNLVVLIGILGVVSLALGRRRLGSGLLCASALLIAAFGWTTIGAVALAALENRFPRPEVAGAVTGVIMLGGAVDTHVTGDRGDVALNEGGERLAAVAELSRRYPLARIVLSGGASHILPTGAISESAAARTLLVAIGVPETRVEMEERSRNTCENAAESANALKPRPGEQWLLITSANHMPRAVACFRSHGFPVLPYPVDFRTRRSVELFGVSPSIADGLATLDLAAHEWIGLATYRLFGLTRELFPAPADTK